MKTGTVVMVALAMAAGITAYATTLQAGSSVTVPCIVNDKGGDLLAQMTPGAIAKVEGDLQLAHAELTKVDVIGVAFELSEALPALSAGLHRRPDVRQASSKNHFVSVWVKCRLPKNTKVIDFSSLRLSIGKETYPPIGLGTERPVNRDSNFNSFEIGASVLPVDGSLQPLADMNMGIGKVAILAGHFPDSVVLRFAFEVPQSSSDYVLKTEERNAQ
jgi:hypothetical protein